MQNFFRATYSRGTPQPPRMRRHLQKILGGSTDLCGFLGTSDSSDSGDSNDSCDSNDSTDSSGLGVGVVVVVVVIAVVIVVVIVVIGFFVDWFAVEVVAVRRGDEERGGFEFEFYLWGWGELRVLSYGL